MYDIATIVDGVKYTIYFFATFSGHFHPFTPVDPLEFDEIHNSIKKYNKAVYYQGWYSETSEGPRLDRLVKYSLISQPYKGEFEYSTVPGVYYHRLEKVNGQWIVKGKIEPDVALKQKRYLRYVINNSSKLESTDHIYASIMYELIYTYNECGVLTNVNDDVFETPTKIPNL